MLRIGEDLGLHSTKNQVVPIWDKSKL